MEVQSTGQETRFPSLEVKLGEPIYQPIERLEEEFNSRGITLSAFEKPNTVLPSARFSNFFQARIDGVETILVVMTEEWTPSNVVIVVNILLDIRSDPDPPGAPLRFRFFSAHPPPSLLDTLFGDYRVSPLECRAAMIANFGNDLRPGECTRLAAAGMHFMSVLGVKTSFGESGAFRAVGEFIVREIRQLGFPLEKAPLNLLICIGCFYGEAVRSLLGCETEWALVKEFLPWPCLIVRPAGKGNRSLGFSPLALVLQLSQSGEADVLEKNALALRQRATADVRESSSPAPGAPGR